MPGIVNVGLGSPKKRSAPPPPFGGQDEPAPQPERKALAFAPKSKGPVAPEPAPEPTAGGSAIPPEAVSYRSEAETCVTCTYNAQGNCDRLQMPVSDGDSCNLFEDKGSGMDLEATEQEPDAN